MDSTASKKRLLSHIAFVSFHHGKRRFAVAFDSIFIWTVILLAVRITLIPYVRIRAAAWIASAFFTLTFFFICRVVQRERFVRHKLKMRSDAREAAALFKARFDPDRLYALIKPQKGVVAAAKTDLLSADDITEAVRENGLPLKLVTLAEPTEKAAALIERSDNGISIVSPQEHLGIALEILYPVSEEEIDDEIIRSHREMNEKRSLGEIFLTVSRKRAVKYLLVGGGLFLFSFFMHHRLYYRLIACVSASAGGFMLFLEELPNKTGYEKKKPA